MPHVIVKLWPKPEAQKQALAAVITQAVMLQFQLRKCGLSVPHLRSRGQSRRRSPMTIARSIRAFLEQEQVGQDIRNSRRYVR